MSIADAMRSQLSASVGNTQTNTDEDVRKVKDRLNRLGWLEEKPEEKNSLITRDLDEAIKGFQKDTGLKVDGIIKPGGETESMLTFIEQKPKQDRAAPLGNCVGNNTTNHTQDVQAVQSLLSQIGLLPKVKQVKPTGILDASDDAAIKSFQKQNNLKVDGLLTPGGETETALKQAAQPEEKPTPPKPEKKPLQPPKPPQKPNLLEEIIPPKQEEKQELEQETSSEKEGVIQEEHTQEVTEQKSLDDNKKEAVNQPMQEAPNTESRSAIYEIQDSVIVHEKDVKHMYMDSTNHVTVGIGHMIPNEDAAVEIPFQIRLADRTTRAATEEEIRQAYRKVQAARQPEGAKSEDMYSATTYKPEGNPNFDDLFLENENMRALMVKDLEEAERQVRTHVTNYDDLPLPAQKAILDMKFNMGRNFSPKKWPKFHEAILKDNVEDIDWETAAQESNRLQLSKERNQEIFDWFIQAGED